MSGKNVDLGSDHVGKFFVWDPDLDLNPQYRDLPGSPEDYVGLILEHKAPDGSDCVGAIHFDTPRTRRMDETVLWTVISWEPLEITPSILCRTCGDHGHIVGGKWVPAA